ncbi:MAG: KamA family radical SAM protein [Candidatus Aminicenantes bacterium]|nr:KamA family radical SAM protein [Candidatus Aminicenantes bacterium]
MNENSKSYLKRWKRCWHVAPDIHLLLKESKSLDSARHKMMNYLNSSEAAFRNDYFELSNADFILFEHSLMVLKNFFSMRYERIAKTSPLEFIWKASRDGDSDVADDFIDEFEHLFRAIKGNTKVYPSYLMEGVVSPDFEKYSGRVAGKKRSDFLDLLGENIDEFLERYPDGLKPEIVAKRKENKKRILKIFQGTEENWKDYIWQFRNVIKSHSGLEKLKSVIKLSDSEEEATSLAIENNIPFGVTPHYLHLMDEKPSDYDFAIRRQVFPPIDYVKAMMSHKNDRSIFDFMREHDTSPVDHVTRRYIKVAILKPYDTCPQICVYCQRNWEITSPSQKAAQVLKKDIDKAVKWIAKHDQIMDLLVTGGDPLIMSNKVVSELLSQLATIPHLRSIRIASRVPITVPQRIDDELVDILAQYNGSQKRFLCFVTHFSHPYEINQETAEVINKLRMKGITVYNQQVFTIANSRRFETVALRIGLKMIGVDPYYVFNLKGKSELINYAAPVARILQERQEEARLMPGIYRSDEPVFNVPFLGKNHMRAWQDHELISILPSGRRVYAFHAWEKNIRKVDSYIYTDISIRSYLNKLAERGEDLEEYNSIWYYY